MKRDDLMFPSPLGTSYFLILFLLSACMLDSVSVPSGDFLFSNTMDEWLASLNGGFRPLWGLLIF